MDFSNGKRPIYNQHFRGVSKDKRNGPLIPILYSEGCTKHEQTQRRNMYLHKHEVSTTNPLGQTIGEDKDLLVTVVLVGRIWRMVVVMVEMSVVPRRPHIS